ncbi:MAG: transposase [Dehalococcoidia bacterium]|nr:transposase [Dehalococcoidia bacterium]
MTIEDTQELFAALAGILIVWGPLVAALTEAVKRIRPALPTEAYPLIAIVFGMAAGLFYIAPGDARMGALYGIAVALTSCGLYSGAKAAVGRS